MGRAGRRRIEAHYDWDVKVGYMLNLYRQALRIHAMPTRA